VASASSSVKRGSCWVDRDAGHRGGERDLRRYCPWPRGLSLITSSSGGVVLQQDSRERRLADDEVQVAVPVRPEFDLAALISVTACDVGVTVPVFGSASGHAGRAPAETPTCPSGRGRDTASKSRKPPWMRSIIRLSRRSRRPPRELPRPVAGGEDEHAAVLPVPFGRLTVPRTIWSCLRGSTPSRSATSTVGSNFVTWPDLAIVTPRRSVKPLVVDLLVGLAVRLTALHGYLHVWRLWSATARGPATVRV